MRTTMVSYNGSLSDGYSWSIISLE